MDRREQFMPNGVPKNIRIYDDGETFDRYTVVFTGRFKGRERQCFYLGMSHNPTHPQGFSQHHEADYIIDKPAYGHLGKKITFDKLPTECQKVVISAYKELWGLW